MKAIILAAGYATRLYPLTLDRPKALLDVGGQAVLDYIVDEIETIDEVDEIVIVSNHKYYVPFVEWSLNRKPNKLIKVIDDGTISEEDKLGAIGDIKFAIDKENINEDIMVIAGDTLFTYKLLDFYNYYQNINKDCILTKELDRVDDLHRFAVALLDNDGKIIDFEEKPQYPKSNIVAYATYIYQKETLPLIEQYLKEGNNPDAPGHFAAWLYKKKDVFAYTFDGECYDIGTHETYNEVRQKYGKLEGKKGVS